MKSIARALNNVAQSIQAVATAINNSKKVEIKPVTTTSNPTSAVKITTPTIVTPSKSYSEYVEKDYYLTRISSKEKKALDAIYAALADKGKHPDHHDYIMRELSTKWPVLHAALTSLVDARKKYYNKSYSPYNDIWKSKDKW